MAPHKSLEVMFYHRATQPPGIPGCSCFYSGCRRVGFKLIHLGVWEKRGERDELLGGVVVAGHCD